MISSIMPRDGAQILSLGHGDSGLPARIAGDAIGADAHLGNMATEEFLSCLSKTAIERVGSSLNVLPRQRAKDTRAAVVAEAAGSTYIHPAALFALSQAEIAHHSEAPRDDSWGYGDTDDTTEEADGAPRAENNSLEPEPDHDLDNMDSDENAHLGDEDPPRSHAAAAAE
jgi:ParB family transcriptional regulator, chromosome partitioning protein